MSGKNISAVINCSREIAELKSCFDKVYTDGRALQYISAYWTIAKTERNIKWLNQPCVPGRTLKDCFLRESAAIIDFIEFAADCENMLTV